MSGEPPHGQPSQGQQHPPTTPASQAQLQHAQLPQAHPQPMIQPDQASTRKSGGGDIFLVVTSILCFIGSAICLIKGVLAGISLSQTVNTKPDLISDMFLEYKIEYSETLLIVCFGGFVALLGIGQCCAKLAKL